MNRKLDAMIAITLGRKVVEREGEYWYPGRIPYRVEFFSIDGNDMLELDKEMQARGYWIEDCWFIPTHPKHDNPHAGWYVFYRDNNDNSGIVENIATLPMAVALAAYKALTGKDWKEECPRLYTAEEVSQAMQEAIKRITKGD